MTQGESNMTNLNHTVKYTREGQVFDRVEVFNNNRLIGTTFIDTPHDRLEALKDAIYHLERARNLSRKYHMTNLYNTLNEEIELLLDEEFKLDDYIMDGGY
jgi:hypothetical protein